jgi:hypothetical protein
MNPVPILKEQNKLLKSMLKLAGREPTKDKKAYRARIKKAFWQGVEITKLEYELKSLTK